MKQQARRYVILVLASAAAGFAVWALLHFTVRTWHQTADSVVANIRNTDELWAEGVEKVKADRGEEPKNVSLVIPLQLQHYEDRRWFLATQVAEVHKQNVQSCQDFVDLAAMIVRGEMKTVPAATETYILFGVGAKADDGVFSRYQDDHDIELYNEAQLSERYAEIEVTRTRLQKEIADLKSRSGATKKSKSGASKEIAAQQPELQSLDQDKALLDQFYGQTASREKLFSEYESLKALAKNFGGRTFDIDNSGDRQAMKLSMLRSIRPEVFKVIEEIAAHYHSTFDRPLPVSSLVRPEQYQHVLRRVNRNATLIDTPPHSTGLAFDIDYRYMSAAEQNFVMNELARLKDEGRIEVLRERNANYHVFVFIDGTRPSDTLITASLDEVAPPVKEANHVETKPAKVRGKSQKVKHQAAKPKARKRR
jgi:Family of unknown function (DUF5715)